MNRTLLLISLLPLALSSGCVGRPAQLETVSEVELERFMGDWYVIAHIPKTFERNAYNAVESYVLNGRRIDTTFSFRSKSFDGKQKSYRPNAIVTDEESNAVWGMQFLWPFRSDYRIAHLDDDYETTIIGRNKRDYVWIMARQPSLSENELTRLSRKVASMGYDIEKLRRVPQQWREPGAP